MLDRSLRRVPLCLSWAFSPRHQVVDAAVELMLMLSRDASPAVKVRSGAPYNGICL